MTLGYDKENTTYMNRDFTDLIEGIKNRTIKASYIKKLINTRKYRIKELEKQIRELQDIDRVYVIRY